MKKLFAFWISMLAACMLLTACSNPSPEPVAKDFMQKVLTGDADGALKLVAMPEKDLAAVEILTGKVRAGVVRMKAQTEKWGGVDKIQVVSVTYKTVDAQTIKANQVTEGSLAFIKMDVTFKNGHTEDYSTRLIKTSSGWKIYI